MTQNINTRKGINWKLRFQNKTTLIAIVSCFIGLVYQTLGIIGYVPPISKESVVQWAGEVINFLSLVGIIVDSTTKGIKDSPQAMTYDKPRG